jgi:hypothetical protein
LVAVVVGGAPLLILVLYAAFLMVVRTVMLGFCVVSAPLCLATAVFDANNRFFHWWLDLLGSVLLTPLVLGMAIALSLTLASHVVVAFAIGPLLAVVIMCGWFPAESRAGGADAHRGEMCHRDLAARATSADQPREPSAPRVRLAFRQAGPI